MKDGVQSDEETDLKKVAHNEERTEFLTKTIQTQQKEKLTPKYMTKYERARILGVRAFQICSGAPVMVQLQDGEADPIAIALRELKVLHFKFFF